MYTIEQELEASCTSEVYEVRNLRWQDEETKEVIYADVYLRGERYATGWSFNAKTGVMLGHETNDNPMRIRPKSAELATPEFYVHVGQREWGKEGWVKCKLERFDTGAEAAERVKQHNGYASSSLSPFRFMVKKEIKLQPIADYPNWAASRFVSGEWQPLPWADEPWVLKEHYAHVCKADEFMVAYYETEQLAQIDSVSVITPGRYLQRFYSDVLTPTEIRDWAVKLDVEATLKFASTPDEIEKIYTAQGAPHSCMVYPENHWSHGVQPSRVYGAGDLALAYLERKGKIVARALVWPDKKVAGRRYGDIERLTDALIADGYEIDSNDSSASGRGNGGLSGARLLKIQTDADAYNGGPNYVMPYLDSGYRCAELDPPSEEFFQLTKKSIGWSATNTHGYLVDPESDSHWDYYCDACEDGLHSDDAYHVGDSTYCEDCADNRSFICNACNDREPDHRRVTVDGEAWCESCYENDGYSCDGSEDNCVGRMSSCNATHTEDGNSYCSVCAPEETNSCDYCDCTFSKDALRIVYDARYDDPEDADQHADACNECVDSNDSIQLDLNGKWIDTDTATQCENEECEAYFSGSLEAEECPRCQPVASNENETTNEEVAA